MSPQEKLRAAKAYLGQRYTLHPRNRVQKADYDTKNTKTDLAETFARARKRLARDV